MYFWNKSRFDLYDKSYGRIGKSDKAFKGIKEGYFNDT